MYTNIGANENIAGCLIRQIKTKLANKIFIFFDGTPCSGYLENSKSIMVLKLKSQIENSIIAILKNINGNENIKHMSIKNNRRFTKCTLYI
jgi:hypothetical protein